MDEPAVPTALSWRTLGWVTLPWVVGALVLVARSVARWRNSDALEAVSPVAVAVMVTGAILLRQGPGTARARWAAGLVVACGAVIWFVDLHNNGPEAVGR